MYKHSAEAFVCVAHSNCITEGLCARAQEYCRSIRRLEHGKLLNFDDARAIVRPTDKGLHFRVEAQDLVMFCGIRTLLQGSLSAITTFPDAGIEWHPPGGVSIGAILNSQAPPLRD